LINNFPTDSTACCGLSKHYQKKVMGQNSKQKLFHRYTTRWLQRISIQVFVQFYSPTINLLVLCITQSIIPYNRQVHEVG